MTSNSLITLTNVHFTRGSKTIFSGINLTIDKGKVVAILGPSGTGKTTLLRLIGGELSPDEGHIVVMGEDVHQLSRQKLHQLRRKMGLLFQSGALFSDLSVFENVAFPIREHTKLSESMIRDIVLMKLEAVGLRGAHPLMPSELSGGMARRVALARAVALDPTLMLYDEPFTGQDPISMGMLVTLIKKLNHLLDITTVIVSHDVDETLSIADYVYLIAEGLVVGEGTPAALRESKNPHVVQFLGGLPDGAVPFHYPACDYAWDLLNA